MQRIQLIHHQHSSPAVQLYRQARGARVKHQRLQCPRRSVSSGLVCDEAGVRSLGRAGSCGWAQGEDEASAQPLHNSSVLPSFTQAHRWSFVCSSWARTASAILLQSRRRTGGHGRHQLEFQHHSKLQQRRSSRDSAKVTRCRSRAPQRSSQSGISRPREFLSSTSTRWYCSD